MIANRQRSVRVSAPRLAQFLRRALRILRLPSDAVAVCLIEDAEMARLNQTYRGKVGPTDVLSFPVERRRRPRRTVRRATGSAAGGNGHHFLGDIAISPAAARRNANDFGRSLPDELRILVLHGVLHLLGYDHENDHGEMERYEARLRKRLGIA